MADRDTIFALSSGPPPSGVAVIRVSGPQASASLQTIAGVLPEPRRASLRTLRDPRTGEPIDQALILSLPGPRSETGEDCAEFHLHGGRAVITALLAALGAVAGCRLAEPGEFTRRAFENQRIDLTEVEGLADLVAAETEAQRVQALYIAGGGFARRAESWRSALVEARAAIEADLDFSDEEDVPGSVAERADMLAAEVLVDVERVLSDGHRGERIRDGLRVAILGPPNAGKSSLLNALAGRDAAIVTPIAGTTRDVIEVRLDLEGVPVTLFDTAGIRSTEDPVEVEGVRRAEAEGRAADVVLWLDEADRAPPDLGERRGIVVRVRSKLDLADHSGPVPTDSNGYPLAVSIVTGAGLGELETALARHANNVRSGEAPLVTRTRHRMILEGMRADLHAALEETRLELKAESLRGASDGIGRLTGRIDVEEVLGTIFSSFCIGK